jgi:hypothetical protein
MSVRGRLWKSLGFFFFFVQAEYFPEQILNLCFGVIHFVKAIKKIPVNLLRTFRNYG